MRQLCAIRAAVVVKSWEMWPPQPRPGPHYPRPGAPRRQRRGDADVRGRLGRPFLFQPPREGGLPRCLELIQSHVAQKPVLRGEVGCACVAREVSVVPRCLGARSRCYCCLDPIPPTEGGGWCSRHHRHPRRGFPEPAQRRNDPPLERSVFLSPPPLSGGDWI